MPHVRRCREVVTRPGCLSLRALQPRDGREVGSPPAWRSWRPRVPGGDGRWSLFWFGSRSAPPTSSPARSCLQFARLHEKQALPRFRVAVCGFPGNTIVPVNAAFDVAKRPPGNAVGLFGTPIAAPVSHVESILEAEKCRLPQATEFRHVTRRVWRWRRTGDLRQVAREGVCRWSFNSSHATPFSRPGSGPHSEQRPAGTNSLLTLPAGNG